MFTQNKKVAIVLSLLFTFSLIAQTTFSKRIHYGVRDSQSEHIMLRNDTFYLAVSVGVKNQLEPAPWATSLLKVDLNGSVIQPQNFYQPDSTQVESLNSLYTSDGNKFYSAAIISHWNKNDVLCGLVIFDKNGDTIAIKTYGDTTHWNGVEWVMKKTNEPNRLLLFGLSDSLCSSGHNGYCRIIVRVVDTLGNLITTKYYLTVGTYKYFQNADTTVDKGYMISGFEPLNNNGTGLSYLLKLDSSLNQVWFKTYFACNSIPNSVYSLKHGGFIQTYASWDSTFQNFAYYSRLAMQKVDDNGNTVWHKEYGTLERNVALSNVKELPNGDLIACGVLDVPIGTSGSKQAYGVLLKTDSAGNEKWMQLYKGAKTNDNVGQSFLYDVVVMPDGGYTAAGYVTSAYVSSTDTTGPSVWILRVDSNGCLTPGCTPASNGIKQLSTNGAQFSAYPNPFNNELMVSVTLPENIQGAMLQLIEPATGRILMEKPITDKQQEVVFDTKELSSGLYLVGIKSANSKAQFIKVATFK